MTVIIIAAMAAAARHDLQLLVRDLGALAKMVDILLLLW